MMADVFEESFAFMHSMLRKSEGDDYKTQRETEASSTGLHLFSFLSFLYTRCLISRPGMDVFALLLMGFPLEYSTSFCYHNAFILLRIQLKFTFMSHLLLLQIFLNYTMQCLPSATIYHMQNKFSKMNVGFL